MMASLELRVENRSWNIDSAERSASILRARLNDRRKLAQGLIVTLVSGDFKSDWIVAKNESGFVTLVARKQQTVN